MTLHRRVRVLAAQRIEAVRRAGDVEVEREPQTARQSERQLDL